MAASPTAVGSSADNVVFRVAITMRTRPSPNAQSYSPKAEKRQERQATMPTKHSLPRWRCTDRPIAIPPPRATATIVEERKRRKPQRLDGLFEEFPPICLPGQPPL